MVHTGWMQHFCLNYSTQENVNVRILEWDMGEYFTFYRKYKNNETVGRNSGAKSKQTRTLASRSIRMIHQVHPTSFISNIIPMKTVGILIVHVYNFYTTVTYKCT